MATKEFDAMTAELSVAMAEAGRKINALLDATFPERVALREAVARLGYQGNRSGWYPERPKRRSPRARRG